eukprot:CAMPEP_0182923860 /NCGR_PEP_ID=MMETSP0105_2-20130417/5693_1 /TAXON_ID=81532 ORGANISM="Acanthoeca-like sp., Strain 10tr" /NCGR_SAMPLE_ID=MMETSP0105_2 /ASSEMBLY_ACC=CAM_ASM_000205 /LENGTH=91 /DNA_ID=CAMNT_0025061599 /DNA_START=118 /DNA_END=389 /DNA_ORIENTATION=+
MTGLCCLRYQTGGRQRDDVQTTKDVRRPLSSHWQQKPCRSTHQSGSLRRQSTKLDQLSQTLLYLRQTLHDNLRVRVLLTVDLEVNRKRLLV